MSVTQVILHQRRALRIVFLRCVMKLPTDCLQTLCSDMLHRRLACGLLPQNHYLNVSAIVLCSGQDVQKSDKIMLKIMTFNPLNRYYYH